MQESEAHISIAEFWRRPLRGTLSFANTWSLKNKRLPERSFFGGVTNSQNFFLKFFLGYCFYVNRYGGQEYGG